jgi:hypothetical protein
VRHTSNKSRASVYVHSRTGGRVFCRMENIGGTWRGEPCDPDDSGSRNAASYSLNKPEGIAASPATRSCKRFPSQSSLCLQVRISMTSPFSFRPRTPSFVSNILAPFADNQTSVFRAGCPACDTAQTSFWSEFQNLHQRNVLVGG